MEMNKHYFVEAVVHTVVNEILPVIGKDWELDLYGEIGDTKIGQNNINVDYWDFRDVSINSEIKINDNVPDEIKSKVIEAFEFISQNIKGMFPNHEFNCIIENALYPTIRYGIYPRDDLGNPEAEEWGMIDVKEYNRLTWEKEKKWRI